MGSAGMGGGGGGMPVGQADMETSDEASLVAQLEQMIKVLIAFYHFFFTHDMNLNV